MLDNIGLHFNCHHVIYLTLLTKDLCWFQTHPFFLWIFLISETKLIYQSITLEVEVFSLCTRICICSKGKPALSMEKGCMNQKETLCMLWINLIIFTDCGEILKLSWGFPAICMYYRIYLQQI